MRIQSAFLGGSRDPTERLQGKEPIVLTVNGEPLDYEPGMRIVDVLERRGYIFPLLIITIDGVHVPRDRYALTVVPDGADVQVIHLMSGG